MTAKSVVVANDPITFKFMKIDRIKKTVEVQITAKHHEPVTWYRTFKEGDSYTYSLRIESELLA